MTCPACAFDNPDDALFCSRCGTRLVPQCAPCGAILPAGARHCTHCGVAVTAPVATAPAGTPQPAPPPELPASFAEGRYQVKRFLGEGGKKKVYLVHDTLLDRDVAFSLIKTQGLDAVGVERIHREAQSHGTPRRASAYRLGL